MQTIEIDFEVFKALTVRRPTEETTYNDVIRDLLRLPPKRRATPEPGLEPESAATGGESDWVYKGVRFPSGTEFRATYKGVTHHGTVRQGGLFIAGQQVSSPSRAAMLITKTNINGWNFWECRFPGEGVWRSIKGFRRVP